MHKVFKIIIIICTLGGAYIYFRRKKAKSKAAFEADMELYERMYPRKDSSTNINDFARDDDVGSEGNISYVESIHDEYEPSKHKVIYTDESSEFDGVGGEEIFPDDYHDQQTSCDNAGQEYSDNGTECGDVGSAYSGDGSVFYPASQENIVEYAESYDPGSDGTGCAQISQKIAVDDGPGVGAAPESDTDTDSDAYSTSWTEYSSDESEYEERQNTNAPQVGCTIPEDIHVGHWTTFNALMFTDKTSHRINKPHIAAKAHKAIKEFSSITIVPTCKYAEFRPERKTDIMWMDNYIDEKFYVKTKKDDVDITIKFYANNISIPIGEVTFNTETSRTTAKTGGVYLVYDRDDYPIIDNIANALYQVGIGLEHDIDKASRIQIMWSLNLKDYLEDIGNELFQYNVPIGITYWNTTSLEELPELYKDVEKTFHNNTMNNILTEVRSISNNTKYIISLLEQCHEMLRANYEAICESSTNNCPHRFHIWPAQKPQGYHRLNPTNWALHKYKLHLLCDGIHDYTGNDADKPHYVFDTHPGYTINVPKNWFKKWGPIIAITTKLIAISAKIAIAATGAGSLANLIPNGIPIDKIKEAIPFVDIVSEELTGSTVGELVANKAQGMLSDMEAALENAPELQQTTTEMSFNELEMFLDKREPYPLYAGLTKHFHDVDYPKAGKVMWICNKHSKLLEESLKCKESFV